MYASRIHTRIGSVNVSIASFRWHLPLFKLAGGLALIGSGANPIVTKQWQRARQDTSVDLVNFYFVTAAPPAATGQLKLLASRENPQRRQSANQRRTVAYHVCTGFERTPALFPDGVLTVTSVIVGNVRPGGGTSDEYHTFVTAAGKVPDHFAVDEALRSHPVTVGFVIGTRRVDPAADPSV